jgi:hypothetical protein
MDATPLFDADDAPDRAAVRLRHPSVRSSDFDRRRAEIRALNAERLLLQTDGERDRRTSLARRRRAARLDEMSDEDRQAWTSKRRLLRVID